LVEVVVVIGVVYIEVGYDFGYDNVCVVSTLSLFDY
jgi:hypothetical protein